MDRPRRENEEPLAALERLHRRGVLTQEEAQAAARALTGDESLTFPPVAHAPEGPTESAPESG